MLPGEHAQITGPETNPRANREDGKKEPSFRRRLGGQNAERTNVEVQDCRMDCCWIVRALPFGILQSEQWNGKQECEVQHGAGDQETTEEPENDSREMPDWRRPMSGGRI